MKKLFYAIIFMIVANIVSCVSPKEILYLQDAMPSSKKIENQSYQTKIQKDDILSIIVSSSDPAVVVPFNKLFMNSSSVTALDKGYLVDPNGYIVFPILGRIKAEGLTTLELSDTLSSKLINGKYILDPSVAISQLNFKFSVIGEVKTPKSYNILSQRVTLLEALSMAGDLHIQANRSKISIIREMDGVRQIAQVDLRSKDFLSSPYYYLAQNDVIYVEPTKRRINQSADRQWLPLAFSGTSVLLTIISILVK